MRTRSLLVTAAALAAVLLPQGAAHAQQSLALNIGHFSVRGAGARIADDVLLENLNVFSFELTELNSVTFGGEWLIGLGDHLEAGVGVGYMRGTALSTYTYTDFVNDDGTDILQDFHLETVPVTGTLRLFPFGDTAVRPYIGAGIGVFLWRYSEVGEFIDFYDYSVFRDRFVAGGADIGAVVLGGVRVPLGSSLAAGVEVQYQRATGRVGVDEGFLAERIDLGGLTTRFTFQIEF